MTTIKEESTAFEHMDDNDESRLQAAELIISLSSGVHADNYSISSVPTTTSSVCVEKVEPQEPSVLITYVTEQGYVSPHYTELIAEKRTGVVAGDSRPMPEPEEDIIFVDMVVPNNSNGGIDSTENTVVEEGAEMAVTEYGEGKSS